MTRKRQNARRTQGPRGIVNARGRLMERRGDLPLPEARPEPPRCPLGPHPNGGRCRSCPSTVTGAPPVKVDRPIDARVPMPTAFVEDIPVELYDALRSWLAAARAAIEARRLPDQVRTQTAVEAAEDAFRELVYEVAAAPAKGVRW
jgi:hypothetical protein